MIKECYQKIAYGLVGLGFFILIINSGVLAALPSFLWLMIMFAIGASFLRASEEKLLYWQRLLGFAAIGIVSIITVSKGEFAGAAALGFPAIAFALMYLNNRRRWWAIIPAGLMASLSTFLIFIGLFPRWEAVPILFLGFAATFATIYLRVAKRWALFPAVLFIILTVIVNDPSNSMPGWFLPFTLIGSGLAILWWWQRDSS